MKFDWKPHPKQREFMEDDRPRVLYGGGLTSKGYWIQLFRSLLMNEIKCPFCTNDNPNMFSFGSRTRHEVQVHCESCAKDFTHKFNVPAEKAPLPVQTPNEDK